MVSLLSFSLFFSQELSARREVPASVVGQTEHEHVALQKRQSRVIHLPDHRVTQEFSVIYKTT